MTQADVKNKMKTLSEGQFTDRVLTQMALTFTTLVKLANFSGVVPADSPPPADQTPSPSAHDDEIPPPPPAPPGQMPLQGQQPPVALTSRFGLLYNINIHLPESRDQAVYDALFKALKEHLT